MAVRHGIAVLLAGGLWLSGCGNHAPPAATLAGPVVETMTVAAGAGAGGVSWDGTVQAVQQAVLSAQTSGRIVELPADVDQDVAAGAVLLRLTDTEQRAAVDTAQARLHAAEAQLVDAANRFQRASGLAEQRLISSDDFDRIRAARDSAAAARDAAAAQLAQAGQQLRYTVVRAPYRGVIAARHVELGETVSPGQALYTLYAPGPLRLEVQVPQADAELLRQRAGADITLADGRQLHATRIIVYPGADPLAHSTTVRVLLPAMERPPRPGQTAKVRFAGGPDASGLWLPRTAVVERGELSGCYVVDAQGIMLRQLRLGQRDDGRVEVIAGLAPGERVALDPVAALQALQQRQAGTVVQRD